MKTNRITRNVGVTLTVTAACVAFMPPTALADGFEELARFRPPAAREYTEWRTIGNVETSFQGTHPELNTAGPDFCPAISSDGRTLYFVSIRDGGLGGSDIWVARRKSVYEPWGEPENPGAPVNSPGNELCSTPHGSHVLLIVSNREGGCGGTDIYVTWRKGAVWADPLHLDCDINSPGDEMAPTILTYFDPRLPWWPTMELYFSSNRAGGLTLEGPDAAVGDADIYYAKFRLDGSLTRPRLVPGVNSIADDHRPTLRADGLEIFFDSNRDGGAGLLDIWTSTRRSVRNEWDSPENLGSVVNSPAGESRPSLSLDGTQLYIASTRAEGDGAADLWVASRERQQARERR